MPGLELGVCIFCALSKGKIVTTEITETTEFGKCLSRISVNSVISVISVVNIVLPSLTGNSY
jgi:hypothetical protein